MANAKKGDSFTVTLAQHPEDPEIPYLGVTQIQNERSFLNELKGSIFSWFKNLIKWLAALNVFIGIANLLPLGPVDGGQFLKVFLHEVFPNNPRRAQKWWLGISYVTLILLLLGFIGPSFL